MKKNYMKFPIFLFCLLFSACGWCGNAKKDVAKADNAASAAKKDVSVDVFKEYFTFSVPSGWEKYITDNSRTAEKDGKYQVGLWHDCTKASVSFVPEKKPENDFAQFFGSSSEIRTVEDVRSNMGRFVCKKCKGSAKDKEIDGGKAIEITSRVQSLSSGEETGSVEYIVPAEGGFYSIYYRACDDSHDAQYRYVIEKILETFKGRKLHKEDTTDKAKSADKAKKDGSDKK